MWIASKYGFFSVVAAHDREIHTRPGRPDQLYRTAAVVETANPHPTLMMIRARKRGHLEALARHWPALGPIYETGGTDYPCRIFCGRDIAVAIIAWLVTDIDYCNFKQAQAEYDQGDGGYRNFLAKTWRAGVFMEPYVALGLPEDEEATLPYAQPKPRAARRKAPARNNRNLLDLSEEEAEAPVKARSKGKAPKPKVRIPKGALRGSKQRRADKRAGG